MSSQLLPVDKAAPHRSRASLGMLAIALAGLAVVVALVLHFGFEDIVTAILNVGWGMLVVVLAHVVQVVLSGHGWHAIAQVEQAASLWWFIQARWIREAVSNLLPLTQIGGEVVSLRILVLHGFRNGIAASTMVADLGSQIVSQAVFTLLGLALLLTDGHQGPVVEWTVLGLLASVSVLPIFFLAQRRGLLHATERLFLSLASRVPLLRGSSLDGLHDSIHRLFRSPGALLRSFNAHLLSWLIGSLEIWLILYFMGAEVSPRAALVIESLSQVVRSVAFAVPAALGVQEGGFVLIGALYGLSPQTALALSLSKRVRELILGLPGLLAWQIMEGRRWWRRG